MNKREKLEELHELNIEFINARLEIRRKADKRRDLKHGVFGGAFVAAFAGVLQLFNPINPLCLAMMGGAIIGSIVTAVVYKKTPSEHSELCKLVEKYPEYKERLEDFKAEMGKAYTAEDGLNHVGDLIRHDITRLEEQIEREEREAKRLDEHHTQTIMESQNMVAKKDKKSVQNDKEDTDDLNR